MADEKISELPILTPLPATGVYVPVLDSNEANDADKNKRVDVNDLGGSGGGSGAFALFEGYK